MRRLAMVLVACLFVTTGSAPADSVTADSPPVHVCDSLEDEHIDDRTYRFAPVFRVENGAKPEAVWYQYGDGGMDFSDSIVGEAHRYRESGTYEVEATVFFSVYEEGKLLYGKAEPCPPVTITVD